MSAPDAGWPIGAVLRYEDPNGWCVVLVLDEPLAGRSPALQRCLCLDGTRRFTPVGRVAHWNLGWGAELIERVG